MQKDQSYHEAAIIYNTRLAEFAEELAETLKDDEVQRWCRAVGKQHRFHAKRHQSSLANLERIKNQEAASTEVVTPGPTGQVVSGVVTETSTSPPVSAIPAVETLPPLPEGVALSPAEKAKLLKDNNPGVTE